MNWPKKQEKIIRDFLLSRANKIRLGRVSWAKSLNKGQWAGFLVNYAKISSEEKNKFKQYGLDNDPLLTPVLESLKPFFIKRVKKKPYCFMVGDKTVKISKASEKKFFKDYAWQEAFFYRLSPKLKELLNKTTLIWSFDDNKKGFYGFEDPAFFKDNKIVGYVITHEGMIVLYLTDREKKELEKKGIKFKE